MRIRIVKKDKIVSLLVLQMALLGLLWATTPAGAQNGDQPQTNPTTVDQQPVSSETGDMAGVPVRKDAWTWYWNEKAHIDTSNNTGFWGDDAISNLFKNVSNSVLVPFWNAAMEYDFVRGGLLLVLAGMLLGLGATIVMPKKDKKTD